MRLELSILYRGTLSSCNYECHYCPFAKHWESPEELAEDKIGLRRFVDWVTARDHDQLSVFFTPWGEALIRQWYRDAVVQLSHLPHVSKVAVQTNLSCQLDWLAEATTNKIGLWCTYHPGETTLENFLGQCETLQQLEVAHSVGCVGLREHQREIEVLREKLPDSTYLWVNAFKSTPDYYDTEQLRTFESIDPLFPINNQSHVSLGRSCRTGESVVTVDSGGNVRRCHFVKDVIGNLYNGEIEKALSKRTCPNATCECHIGYVHLQHLSLDRVFGSQVLERIPVSNEAAGKASCK